MRSTKASVRPNGENYYWNCGATDPIQPTCRYKVKPVGVMVAPESKTILAVGGRQRRE
jgi:hypothetical protein